MEPSTLIVMIGLFLAAGVRLSIPIILAALGETYAESSGVMNLAMEGLMEIAALMSFVTVFATNSMGLGVLASILVGGAVGLIVAFLTVTLRLNQIFTGLTLWIFGVGISVFIYKGLFEVTTMTHLAVSMPILTVPYLSQIPIIGPMFFSHDLMVYLGLFLVVVLWLILYKTPIGLKIRAIGERPKVADTLGVNVWRIRYLCLMISGMLGGLGGAYVSLVMLGFYYTHVWKGIVAGRGWIAIIVTNFGNWNPWRVFLGALLIGCVDAFQYRLQTMRLGLPTYFFLMLPYLVAMLLMFVARRKFPESLGKPYRREE